MVIQVIDGADGKDMIGTSDGHRAACWDIPMNPAALRDIRGMIRQTLTAWKLAVSGELADDIVLATTEMLSNAVLYGSPPIQFTLRVSGGTLCAEVTDHGAGRPERQADDEEAEHGRGLMIVEALCDEWGVRPAPERDAKTVWFHKKCRYERDDPHAREAHRHHPDGADC